MSLESPPGRMAVVDPLFPTSVESGRKGSATTRLAFYSHDTFGLGHFRRCLKIAGGLVRALGRVEGVFLTGQPHAALFDLPPGFRVVRLPPVTKEASGRYAARSTRRPYESVLKDRRRLIRDWLSRMTPDLFVIDNVPGGLEGEVLAGLDHVRSQGGRNVLALRDILDAEAAINREWAAARANDVIERLYDEVWVFGTVEDADRLRKRGPLGDAATRVVPCGLLDSGSRPVQRRTDAHPPRILVTGGGGGDARPLVNSYLEAIRRFRPRVSTRLVLGPDYPSLSNQGDLSDFGVEIVTFLPNMHEAFGQADLIVSMAGYNSVCEILEAGSRVVLVPRVRPRAEQWLRARALEERGRALVLHPDTVNAKSLWRAVESSLAAPRPDPERLTGRSVAAGRAFRLLDSNARRRTGAAV